MEGRSGGEPVLEGRKYRPGELYGYHPIASHKILKSVIVSPLEYAGEVWEGNKKVENELEAAQMKAAKIVLGCSPRTSNAAVRAELGIQSLRTGRDTRKLIWQYRLQGMGEERLPKIAREAHWVNKARGRQPIEWGRVVKNVWNGVFSDEEDTSATGSLGGFKEQISEALAEREDLHLRRAVREKEGLKVYGMINERIGFKEYLDGPMDEGTKLKVKFGTGDIALEERRRRFRKVDDEDDKFNCDCGSECEDRVHVVAECPLYDQEREVYMT